MQITPHNILAQNHVYNTGFLALQDSVSREFDKVHTALRTTPARQTKMDKVANAVLRNSVFGFKQGAKGCVLNSLFMPTPTQPFDLRRMHLAGPIGHFLGPAGVLLAGHMLVGTYKPVTTDARQHPRVAGVETFFSKGLTGYAIDGLQAAGNSFDARGRGKSAQACRWGAALVAVASTAVRVAVRALQTCLAIAVGMCVGTMTAVASGFMQMASPPTADVVDLEHIFNAYLAHLNGAQNTPQAA